MKINRTAHIILSIILGLFTLSCNWGCKSKMVEQQNILRQRIIEYYEQSKKENDDGFSYDFLLPQWRQLMSREYYLNHDIYLRINDYTIESITIDGEIALAIVQIKYFLGKEIKKERFFTYWGFTHNNWYLIEDRRIEPFSTDQIKQHKKIITDGIPPEVIENWKKNNPEAMPKG